LAATSNPEAFEIQRAKSGSFTAASRVLQFAIENSKGDVGVVIGATTELTEFGLPELLLTANDVPILAPGFGAQGAKLTDMKAIFGDSSGRVICSVSRAATEGGPSAIVKIIENLRSQL
jgi:orotidine-5'-phosphate decarboxylase